ncbi:MAG: hypothetical protein JNL87_03495 [Burkholderiaceae bacterium]|nr:hypothetical protein [Burkholderiaceae bacterium]
MRRAKPGVAIGETGPLPITALPLPRPTPWPANGTASTLGVSGSIVITVSARAATLPGSGQGGHLVGFPTVHLGASDRRQPGPTTGTR